MFEAQNSETINSTWKVAVSFKIIITTSVIRPCFTTQHQTCKTKIKTETDFWSQTGLVLRPRVSDHITGIRIYSSYTAAACLFVCLLMHSGKSVCNGIYTKVYIHAATVSEDNKNSKLSCRWQTARRICAKCNSMADPQYTTLPMCVTRSNLVVLRQRM